MKLTLSILHQAINFDSSFLAMFSSFYQLIFNRGGVEDTRLEGQGQEHKKNPRPRPRTAFPSTDPVETKDRNA